MGAQLEIDGTLKSWAIPKGPTRDPATKRLAAMVEDHRARVRRVRGQYSEGGSTEAAASLLLGPRDSASCWGDLTALKQIERGDLKFRLQGEKLAGEFAIVLMKGRGKGNEWLLLKKRDSFARPGWDVGGARRQRENRPHAGGDCQGPACEESGAGSRAEAQRQTA